MKLILATEAPHLAVDILGELGFADLSLHECGKSGDPTFQALERQHGDPIEADSHRYVDRWH